MLIKRAYAAAELASANATSQVPAPSTKAEVSDDLRCGAFEAVPPDTHDLGDARNMKACTWFSWLIVQVAGPLVQGTGAGHNVCSYAVSHRQ